MIEMKYVKVVTSDSAMVPDYFAWNCKIIRFVNRTFVDGKWKKNDEPSEVQLTKDIERHLKDGELIEVKDKSKKE